MSVLVKPPSDFSPDLLRHVRAALRKTGRLLPATDEEVVEALNAIEERKAERSQPNLSDPYELFETGNSGDSPPARSETREDPGNTSPHQDEINRSLALARNGEDIPPEIRERMNEDREDQEEDPSDNRPEGESADEENDDESDE
jgi:gas vesicle protein